MGTIFKMWLPAGRCEFVKLSRLSQSFSFPGIALSFWCKFEYVCRVVRAMDTIWRHFDHMPVSNICQRDYSPQLFPLIHSSMHREFGSRVGTCLFFPSAAAASCNFPLLRKPLSSRFAAALVLNLHPQGQGFHCYETTNARGF